MLWLRSVRECNPSISITLKIVLNKVIKNCSFSLSSTKIMSINLYGLLWSIISNSNFKILLRANCYPLQEWNAIFLFSINKNISKVLFSTLSGWFCFFMEYPLNNLFFSIHGNKEKLPITFMTSPHLFQVHTALLLRVKP